MKTIPLSKVRIAPNRQRTTFDEAELRELADSIERNSLLQCIVLRETSEGFVLVAGERRLRAITDLADLGTEISYDGQAVPLGEIPYTLMADLDPLAYEEAELEENIRRVDLTWQERAAATKRLSDLRTKQAEMKGTALPTAASLALEIRGTSEGSNQDIIRKERIVAAHLDNPEVAAAKTVNDAFKVLKRQEAATKARDLGAKVGAIYSANIHQAVNANSLEYMLGLDAEAFDCVITDPPYGMNADQFGDSGGMAAGAHGYADTREYAEQCYAELAKQSIRVTKAQAHLYVFLDLDMWPLAKALFETVGWNVFRTPLIWYKRTGARAPWPEHGPQRKYELILYAVKGKRPIRRVAGDVLDFPSDENLGHAAQKPVGLYQELLSRTCFPGDSVLDPFCGTGPIFPAANELKLKATGIELDQASYGLAVGRIEALKKQLQLDLP